MQHEALGSSPSLKSAGAREHERGGFSRRGLVDEIPALARLVQYTKVPGIFYFSSNFVCFSLRYFLKFSKHVRESEETAQGAQGAEGRGGEVEAARGTGPPAEGPTKAEEGAQRRAESSSERRGKRQKTRPSRTTRASVRSSSSQQRDAPTPGSGDVSSFANGANGYAVDLTDAVAAADCVSAINVDDESGTNGEKAPETMGNNSGVHPAKKCVADTAQRTERRLLRRPLAVRLLQRAKFDHQYHVRNMQRRLRLCDFCRPHATTPGEAKLLELI